MVYKLSKASRYKTTYTMSSLKQAESSNWPQIKPVLGLDLVKADIDKGPWAMAQSPLDFCKQHDLVFQKEKEGYQVWGLHRAPALRVLTLQVGPRLSNLERLPIHMKALLVVFIARATRKRALSDKFLDQLSASATNKGKVDTTGVEETFKNAK